MKKSLSYSVKRKIIQFIAFGFTNIHVYNFPKGKLYTGKFKQFCAPGLNCYSCPAATVSCPIGALQAVSGSMKFDFSFYVIGLLLAFGVLFGRAICAFLCPFGLIQELIGRIPVKKYHLPKVFTYIKYIVLVVFVFILPVAVTDFTGSGSPAFCEYICPAGTLEGGIPLLLAHKELRMTIGGLFILKAVILAVVLIGCMFIHRFFCKTLCPLGAIYGLLNKVSVYHLDVDHDKCNGCGRCALECTMDVNPVVSPQSAECIRCGKCRHVCNRDAIRIGFGK